MVVSKKTFFPSKIRHRIKMTLPGYGRFAFITKEISRKSFFGADRSFTFCPVKFYTFYFSAIWKCRAGNEKRKQEATVTQYQAGKFFDKKRTAVNTRMKYDFPFSPLALSVLYAIDIFFFILDTAPEWHTSRIIDSRLDGRTGTTRKNRKIRAVENPIPQLR